jgi:lipoate-protein ligase A
VIVSQPTCFFLLDSGPGDYAVNMALDEALLEAMPRLGRPMLRFYGWKEKAASFGYFQKYAEGERMTRLRPLVRRPTGGGVVAHDADWTYSLVFPNGHEWYSLSATESYCRAHEWIQRAFAKLHVSRAGAGQCFSGYEKFDLLWNGQKVAGAAQRRKREGLLIQGSVQPPPLPLKKEDWQQAMCETAARRGMVEWIPFGKDLDLIERSLELARRKYSKASYNQQR